MKKIIFLLAILLATGSAVVAQQIENTTKTDTAAANIIAGAPTQSSLTYSALSQFVQSSVTTGSNGGFNFKSTLFGLHDLFFGHGKDSLSNYYLTHAGQRNTQFSLGINKSGTSGDQLSRITSGVTIALINHRDKSVVNFANKAFEDDVDKEGKDISITNICYSTTYIIIPALKANINDKNTLSAAVNAARAEQATKIQLTANWTDNDISQLLTGLQVSTAIIDKVIAACNPGLTAVTDNANAYQDTTHKTKPDANYKAAGDSVFKADGSTPEAILTALTNNYKNLGKKIDMGALFTISLNPGYNVQTGLPDTTTLAFRYLVGLGNNYDKPWSLDIQATGISLRDSTAARKVFGHNKAEFSLGVDKVFTRDKQDNPVVEAEFQGEYDDVLSGRFAHEAQQTVSANLVTSLRISKEFTLPLTLKYAPKNAQLFGFLSVQWNLENNNDNAKSSK